MRRGCTSLAGREKRPPIAGSPLAPIAGSVASPRDQPTAPDPAYVGRSGQNDTAGRLSEVVTDDPETHYTRSADGTNLAYQVCGNGLIDLVFVHGIAIPIDLLSEDPGFVRLRKRLSMFSRTVWFDRRGRGASEGDARDFLVEEIFDADLIAVLDAVGFKQVTMVGACLSVSEPTHFLLTYPERVSSFVLVNSFAHYVREDDYPWGAPPDSLDRLVSAVKENWGWAQRWRSLPRAAWPTSASEPGSHGQRDSAADLIRSPT